MVNSIESGENRSAFTGGGLGWDGIEILLGLIDNSEFVEVKHQLMSMVANGLKGEMGLGFDESDEVKNIIERAVETGRNLVLNSLQEDRVVRIGFDLGSLEDLVSELIGPEVMLGILDGFIAVLEQPCKGQITDRRKGFVGRMGLAK